MDIRLIKSTDYNSMPWKNGLGVTKQIDIQPKDSSFPSDPFSWRLSSAHVEASSDFSAYPGYDRILSVWKGPGLVLSNGVSLEPFRPYQFQGEDALKCSILGEPAVIAVLDYGIIYNRGTTTATMEHLRYEFDGEDIDGEGRINLPLTKGVHYITNTCTKAPFSCGYEVGPGDTLVIDTKAEWQISLNCKADESNEDVSFFHVHLVEKQEGGVLKEKTM